MNKKRKIMVTFSAISLTDIVMLLLIFFLLSSSYVTNTGIKIDLPKATTNDKHISENIIVEISKNNDIFINSKNVTDINELKLNAVRIIEKSNSKIVLLKSDKNVELETIIEVIDALKMSGAISVTIATIEDS